MFRSRMSPELCGLYASCVASVKNRKGPAMHVGLPRPVRPTVVPGHFRLKYVAANRAAASTPRYDRTRF